MSELQGTCLRNRGNKNDEQVAVRHADASGGYTIENQHEDKRMRGIRVNKRGSGATGEQQLDEWRKTERLEHEAQHTSAPSDPCVATEHLVSFEIQSRQGSVLVQESGRVDDDMRITAFGCIPRERMDEGVVTLEKCWSGIEEKMPEISKELNWLRSEQAQCSREGIFQSDPKILTEEKSWRTWKSNQNIVMDEEVVQNIVMDEELVLNIVMDEELGSDRCDG